MTKELTHTHTVLHIHTHKHTVWGWRAALGTFPYKRDERLSENYSLSPLGLVNTVLQFRLSRPPAAATYVVGGGGNIIFGALPAKAAV